MEQAAGAGSRHSAGAARGRALAGPRRLAFASPLLLPLALLVALPLLPCPAGATEAQPPIRSERDAACRDHARTRVFHTPDPQNVGLREIGRRLYLGCMGTSGGKRGRRASR